MSKRYKYVVVADSWGTGGTIKRTTFNSVTIHHSAVRATNNGVYDPRLRAIAYARLHRSQGNKGIAYNFFVPYDDTDIIYVVNYTSGHNWHNGNGQANEKALATLVDGHFDLEHPHPTQLLKTKQINDDLQNNWFTTNKWYSFETNINPKNTAVRRTYSEGIVVCQLHWHNEVAQAKWKTACCGKNLMPYIAEYREKAGNVNWGVTPPPPPPPPPPAPEPIDPCKDIKVELEQERGKYAVLLDTHAKVLEDQESLYESNDALIDQNKQFLSDIAKLEQDNRILKNRLEAVSNDTAFLDKLGVTMRELWDAFISIFNRGK
jgi:regulator of replication initiation timing